MTIIKLQLKPEILRDELEQLSEEWQLDLIQITPTLFRMQPAVHLTIHGITCEQHDELWGFSRDEEATAWEDFLLMHVTHRIADEHGLLLYYEFTNSGKFVEPTIQHFLSFDDYANYVVRNEQGLVRDMKKKWLYDHQKRFIR